MGMIPATGGTRLLTAAVCTRDRPELLRLALRSLAAQEPPPVEILVVDNAPSTDATRLLLRKAFPTVRRVLEPAAGLDFARNRALREAQGAVVAFLDDDAVAGPGWAAALAEVFARNLKAAAVTGRVEPLAVETEAQALFEANGGFSRGTRPRQLPANRTTRLHGYWPPLIAQAIDMGCGANLALRRDAALGVGGFDEALDLSPILRGGGDLDILWRLLEAGFDIEYQPAALAWHEHRREMDAVVSQIIDHHRGCMAFLAKSLVRAQRENRPAILAFLVWRLLKPGVRAVRRLAGSDPLPLSVLMRLWWNCWTSVPAYWTGRRIARRRAALVREEAGLA
jgi:O-antigen biosynthesis protein